MAKIVRIPLRNQVRDQIAERLWSGNYEFNQDLNEAHLAADLGVSRTPLREALVMLASEGLIIAKPNRGFHIPNFDAEAVAELYPILGTLEALAVRELGSDTSQLGKSLRALNSKLQRPGLSKKQQYEADAIWHEALVSECPNQTLRNEIKHLWNRARTIDGAFLRGIANTHGSQVEHDEICVAIESNDLSKASELIEHHWRSGIDVVKAWLKDNEKSKVVAQ